jgi:hypothetical protein
MAAARPASSGYVAMMGSAVTLGVRELLAEPCDLHLECGEGRAVRSHAALLALARCTICYAPHCIHYARPGQPRPWPPPGLPARTGLGRRGRPAPLPPRGPQVRPAGNADLDVG